MFFIAVAELSPALTCSFAVVVLRNDYASTVWVEKKFRRIEPQAFCRIDGAFDTVRIDLTGLNVWYKDMPVVISTVCGRIQTDHPGRPLAVLVVKK